MREQNKNIQKARAVERILVAIEELSADPERLPLSIPIGRKIIDGRVYELSISAKAYRDRIGPVDSNWPEFDNPDAPTPPYLKGCRVDI